MHTQHHPLIDYLPRTDAPTAFAARVRVYTAAICGDAGVADVLLTGVPREQHDAVERHVPEVIRDEDFTARVAAYSALLSPLSESELLDSAALRARFGVTADDEVVFQRARVEALCDAMESL